MLRITLHSTKLETYVGEFYKVKTSDVEDILPRRTVTEVIKMHPDREDYDTTFKSRPYRKSVTSILSAHLERVRDVMKNPDKYNPKANNH